MSVAIAASVERSFLPASFTPSAVVAPSDQSGDEATAAASLPGSAEPGIKVSLSSAGLARSKAEDKNSDIDESDLPTAIKQLLKMIRELKAQLAEKMAELQSLTAQSDMDDETRAARAQALQTEIGSISGALSTASAELTRLMREQKLSSEQSATVASLMM